MNKNRAAKNMIALSNIIMRDSLSLRCRLIAAKRIARIVSDMESFDRSEYKASIEPLKASAPFTDYAVKVHEELIAAKRNVYMKIRQDMGSWLLSRAIRDQLDEELGFHELCDVLGINPVHREKAQVDGDRSIVTLVFVLGLEDSAEALSGRQQPSFNHSPLYACYLAAFFVWMRSNPDQVPNPFAPGAPFYGVENKTLSARDGLRRIKLPLVVHDPDGSSRVVQRDPERIR